MILTVKMCDLFQITPVKENKNDCEFIIINIKYIVYGNK